jgi:hypothetical protein
MIAAMISIALSQPIAPLANVSLIDPTEKREQEMPHTHRILGYTTGFALLAIMLCWSA